MSKELHPDRYVKGNLEDILRNAIENRSPYSIIRIGDGELWILSYLSTKTYEDVRVNCPWSAYEDYCGISFKDFDKAKPRMVEAIRNADIVGIFDGDEWTNQVFDALGVFPKNISYAFCNLGMPMHKPFVKLIKDYPPLLVGKSSEIVAKLLYDKIDVYVPGFVSIKGYSEIDKCIETMLNIPHQWSLVSAGANADIICYEMAKHGKVSFDFGHSWDNAFNPDFEKYYLETNLDD